MSSGWKAAGKPRQSSSRSFSLGRRTDVKEEGTQSSSTTIKPEESQNLPTPLQFIETNEAPKAPLSPTDSEIEEIVLDVSPRRVQSLRMNNSVKKESPLSSRASFHPNTGKLEPIKVDPIFSQVSFTRQAKEVKEQPTPEKEQIILDDSSEEEQTIPEEDTTQENSHISKEEKEISVVPSDPETNRSFGTIAPKEKRRSQQFSIGTRTAQFQQQILESRQGTKEEQKNTKSISTHHSEPDLKALLPVSPPASTQSVRDFREANQLLTTPSSQSVSSLQPQSSKRYEKLFLKYFKLSDDHFVDHALCSYQQAISIRGRIYISHQHLCFHSKHYRRVIPFSDIQFIEKQTSALLFPNAIVIVCYDTKRHLFCNFQSRDDVFALLQTFMPSSVASLSPSHTRGRSVDLQASTDSQQGRRPQRTRSLSDHFEAITEKGNYVVQKARQLSEVMLPTTPKREEEETTTYTEHFEAMVYPRTPLDDEAHSKFQLPHDERVFELCFCHMKRNGTYQPGRLYLTQHYLCFQTILLHELPSYEFQLSLELMETINKHNIAQNFSTGIKIATKAAANVYFFAFIRHQERIYQSILDAKAAYNEIDSSVSFIEGKGRDLYRKHFVRANLVSPNETLIATTRCTIRDPVTRRGHVYITENFVCYHVLNYKAQRKEIISLVSIYKVKQRHESLILYTPSARYVIDTVENIDQIMITINEQLALHEVCKNIADTRAIENKFVAKKQQQRCTVGAYQFSASSFFMKTALDVDIDFADKIQYRLPDGSHSFTIFLHHLWPTSCAPFPTEDEHLRLYSERNLADWMDEFTTKESWKIKKATNDDWPCWITQASKGDQKTFIIHSRRKFLPPNGKTYQDITFVYVQNFISSSYPQQSAKELEQSILEMWNSFQPKVNYEYERGAIQYYLESLSCDYMAYSWSLQRIKPYPEELVMWADEFMQSICYQMEVAEFYVAPQVIEQISKNTQMYHSPLHVIRNVENYTERQCEDDVDWNARVHFYFTWVVEYRYAGFSWRNVITLLRDESCPPSVRDTFQSLIHDLLHMTRYHEALLATTIELKVADPQFMKCFSFNERFAFILLEHHYFRYFLEDEDLKEFYGKLLCGFLHNTDMEELLIPLCKEMAWFSLTPNGCKMLMSENVIPTLFTLLSSSNEFIVAGAAAALVNLLANNKEAKQKLSSCGIVHLLLSRFFASPGKYTVESLSVLLKLLRTSADTYPRQIEVTKENGLMMLTAMLNNHYYVSNDNLLIDICATLWRMINDANRPLLCQGDTVAIICKTLMHSKNLELVRVGVGTLIALCCKNEYNCVSVAKFGIVGWIAEMISTTQHTEIIRNCLLLLLCQCHFEESREILITENILSCIACLAKFGSSNISNIANQVYSVLCPSI